MVTKSSLERHHRRTIGFDSYLSNHIVIGIWQAGFLNFLSISDGTHLWHLSLGNHSGFSSTFVKLLKLPPCWSMMGFWPLIWFQSNEQYLLQRFHCLTPQFNRDHWFIQIWWLTLMLIAHHVVIGIWKIVFLNFLSICDGTYLWHLSSLSCDGFPLAFENVLTCVAFKKRWNLSRWPGPFPI